MITFQASSAEQQLATLRARSSDRSAGSGGAAEVGGRDLGDPGLSDRAEASVVLVDVIRKWRYLFQTCRNLYMYMAVKYLQVVTNPESHVENRSTYIYMYTYMYIIHVHVRLSCLIYTMLPLYASKFKKRSEF